MSDTRRDYGPQGCAKQGGVFFGLLAAVLLLMKGKRR